MTLERGRQIKGLLRHLRSNAVAYAALFVALGGSGYAAFRLPRASVGARQIRNHSITPVKLNPRFTAGTVRGWAAVAAGRIVFGGGHPRLVRGGEPPGRTGVTFGSAVGPACAAIATVALQGLGPDSPNTGGYADAIIVQGSRRWGVNVTTYDAQAQMTPLPFYVAVIC